LWGAFAARHGSAERFFAERFVANYCPLVFMEDSGRNRTPDKLAANERKRLYALCDEHLRALVQALSPSWVIGVGAFAKGRAQEALADLPVKVGSILHPSPASPAANRDWIGQATRQMKDLGLQL
jgi:single-strand selective monofunctional uracil DNA glycosylase